MSQDYNETINLPKTDFPMRAGLAKREPEFLKSWEETDLYHTLMKKNEGKPRFVLHDGPPFANGNLHMGHALNKILKDFIVRYYNMAGYQAPYVPGWDTHGLPIERQAISAYGMNRDKISISEFRKKCEEFAYMHMNTQREQAKRIGAIADWDRPYLTMTPDFEASQIEVFGEMAKKGYIYKGLKPVYWCPHDETALAEAEIEYQDEPCDSIYVKFKLTSDKNGKVTEIVGAEKDVFFVIWTTTTWTLPGNLAISLNPEFEYDLIEANGEVYVLAKELAGAVMQTAGIAEWHSLGTLMGSDFELSEAKHPIMNRNSLIVCGEHVTLDAGTGCVHTAPGFGADDYAVCQKYDIDIIVPVDGKGIATKDAEKYAGMYYEKTTPVILADIKACGALFAKQHIEHSYPHCWRCKHPIIYRATEQWFCRVDAMKDQAIVACDEIKWIPAWGHERMTSMIRERSDWCISRQRIWGVPLPIFTCEDCKKPLINDATISQIAALFHDHGSNVWFERTAEELLPAGSVCECGCTKFEKETDTMDVWLDSGSSWRAVMERREGIDTPVDLYLEGNDQYRGWFQSSLLTSIAVQGKAPYRAVITHGMIVDEERQKMSKSKGNGMAPEDIMNQYGADVMRLWVSSADYRQDMRISKEMLKHISQNYLKIRNTARYILGNLSDFNPEIHVVSFDTMLELDKWAVMKTNELIQRVSLAYQNYEFHTVTHALHNFCVVDLSNFYLDVIKDRLYCDATTGLSRRSAQSAIYFVLDALVRMMAPILCFTADEIWQAMPHGKSHDCENIVFNEMPHFNPLYQFDDTSAEKWKQLISIRDEVNKALEVARNDKIIGKPLEAKVTIFDASNVGDFLSSCIENLADLFIVSEFHVELKQSQDGYQVEDTDRTILIERATGEKCLRCWKQSQSVGQSSVHPNLCERCVSVVSK